MEIREVDTGSGRELRFDAYIDGKRVGFIDAHRAAKKIRGRVVYKVAHVDVNVGQRRKGVATKLYEAAAQEACRRRASLASTDRNPGAYSTDFWEKQVRKGRAREVRGGRFVLDCAFSSDLGRLL